MLAWYPASCFFAPGFDLKSLTDDGEKTRQAASKEGVKARAEGRVSGAGVMQPVSHNTPLPASDLYGCLFSHSGSAVKCFILTSSRSTDFYLFVQYLDILGSIN